MLTEFVLVTLIWAGRQWKPLHAEIFPSQDACLTVVKDKQTQTCVPLIKTVTPKKDEK